MSDETIAKPTAEDFNVSKSAAETDQTNWMVLIYSAYEDETPQNEVDRILPRHRELQAELEGSNQLGPVARLHVAKGNASSVRRSGDDFVVADGPYLETREWLVGFYLIEGTRADAIEAGKRICPFHGHIEVRPVAWLKPA